MIRAVIYAAFQPLYDAITDGNLRNAPRDKAVGVLDGVITLGTSFLTGFYSGEPDVKAFKEGVAVLKPGFEEISGAEYYTKFRNIGGNRVYPNDIAIFLRKFLESTLDGAGLADYVVGAACGSSEMAMPLSGLLGVDVGFIRKSKRRGDSSPRVIPEQEATIKNAVKGNRVVCIEDYVCTARSLRDVMAKVEDYGATSVIGASVANSQEGICLRELVNQRGFHTFRR
ncbi:hypothetical protein COY27_02925 [Candidatus Woesearchaeota archaeon CG_4_10_14_0_2_um_filter_33_13]|nr:MAG: hypothetical protein COY27_02925 [Candidatus Woesearchaeota archaeon CG_4_10_14_0_2_um_filter_33_13]